MAQWWPVSYQLHYAAFGGSHKRENAISVHPRSMDRVRELIPKEELLKWKVQDGWGPLCEFLRRQQPKGTFPRVNEGAEFVVLVKDIRRELLTTAAKRAGLWVTALGRVGTAICWAMRLRERELLCRKNGRVYVIKSCRSQKTEQALVSSCI